MQPDNRAPDCALGDGGSTTDWGCWSVWQRSMLIAVASLCQSASMLSVLVLHSITHSLIHSLIQLLTASRTAERRYIRPVYLCKTPTLPPFGETYLSAGQTDVPLEKRLLWTISDIHSVPLIYKSSVGEEKEFFIEKRRISVEGWYTFTWPDLALSLTESLPPRACYRDTAISQVPWTRSETVLAGETRLDWSPGGEGNYPLWSLRDDMTLCDSFCYSDRREEV